MKFLGWLRGIAGYPGHAGKNEVFSWRNRWLPDDLSSIDFSSSPFGLTEAGLKDFRGLTLGTVSQLCRVKSKRIENCDLSYSSFVNCRFQDCVFIDSKLHHCDFGINTFFNSPAPKCDIKDCRVNWFVESDRSWEDHLRKVTSALPNALVQIVKVDSFSYHAQERAVVFYHGAWSAPSSASLKLLCRNIADSV
ncbi:MAG: pentapeptide repeat-containing protein [Candidatus Obscuribacterales bacterium]|nr:pentapeptide repeat-containing protein [Candidatus Obscuribacterales bacterium]